MTDTEQSAHQTRSGRSETGDSTAWVGWVAFAGIVMIVMGSFQAIVGLVAIFDDGYYLVRSDGLVVNVDYTAWGWVHLLLGVLAFFAGWGIFSGRTWARAVGIGLAVISAVANFAFLAAFPVWATILIAIDILIIYALAAHGREMRAL
jgi:hypothetical protein